MGTRGAEKREVRTHIAQSMPRNYSPIMVTIDLREWRDLGQPLLSAPNLANHSHSLFLLQHWSVRAEADGYFHGLAH